MSAYSDLISAEATLSLYCPMQETSGNISDVKGGRTGFASSGTFTYGVSGYGTLGTAISSSSGSIARFRFADTLNFTGTNPWTIEAWVNRGTDTDGRFVAKFNENTGHGYLVAISGSKLYALRHNGTISTDITGGTTLAANTWYHVAATYDGSNLRIYVNGVSDATAVASTQSESAATPYEFCLFATSIDNTSFTTGPYFLAGSMQHAAVYTSALSQSTLAAHYAAGSATDATVVAPAVDGVGDIPAPTIVTPDATVTAVPAAGTGDLPAPTVTAVTPDATVTAVPADGTGDIPAPTVGSATFLARTKSGSSVLVAAGGTIGSTSAHRAFPTAAYNPSTGTTFMVYRRGTSHGSYDGSLVLVTSTDGGLTWSGESVVLAGSSPSNDYRPGQLRILASGRLVYVVARRTTADKFYPEFIYSDNNGVTWSAPVQISHGFDPDVAFPDDIVEMTNGDLIVSMYGRDTFAGTTWNVRTSKSTNGGATWAALGQMATPAQVGGFNAVESQMALLPSGLYGMFHSEDGTPTDIWRTSSTDGATWAAPTQVHDEESTNRNGVLYHPDGDVIDAYYRNPSSAVILRQSTDGGLTYAAPITVQAAPDGTHIGTVWASPVVIGPFASSSPNLGVATAWENSSQNQADVYFSRFTAGAGISATVIVPPAAATGDIPGTFPMSAQVVAPAAAGTGDVPTPAVDGSPDASITVPPADAVGDVPSPAVTGNATATLAPGSFDAGGSVSAVLATAWTESVVARERMSDPRSSQRTIVALQERAVASVTADALGGASFALPEGRYLAYGLSGDVLRYVMFWATG